MRIVEVLEGGDSGLRRLQVLFAPDGYVAALRAGGHEVVEPD
jgi:hypothetical protein